MIEPSVAFEIESGNPFLAPCVVLCAHCGYEEQKLIVFGIDPEFCFPCDVCGSTDTARMEVLQSEAVS